MPLCLPFFLKCFHFFHFYDFVDLFAFILMIVIFSRMYVCILCIMSTGHSGLSDILWSTHFMCYTWEREVYSNSLVGHFEDHREAIRGMIKYRLVLHDKNKVLRSSNFITHILYLSVWAAWLYLWSMQLCYDMRILGLLDVNNGRH